jgi:probable HAF family extracellular repeat protein
MWLWLTALAVLLGVRMISSRTVQAGNNQYTIVELPGLGGPVASPSSINDKGWILGASTLPGGREEHAVLWVNGMITDLGTLPGGENSSIGFPVKNDAGMLVGFSQTGDTNPLHENWQYVCGPFETRPICQGKDLITLGFVWQNRRMTPLQAFTGGLISEAFGANDLRQVVGVAETGDRDPTCIRPQVLDYFGVIWNPDGSMLRLLPYSDDRVSDHVSAAAAINNNGQVVGASGPCASLSPSLAAHALLWQNGSEIPIDLGDLGGNTNNVAFAINGKGQIVGFSGLSGNTTAHAFLYQNSGPMHDLGTWSRDVFSIAYSINNNGQIVGQSCDASNNCRAVLWQNGATLPIDLNSLVPPGSPTLVVAFDINNQGQIVGGAYDATTSEETTFLLTPE